MLLAVRLVGVWRKWGGNAELPVGRKSRWIRFLQQAHKKIAQRQIGPDAARKLTDRAIAWSRKVERSIASSGLEN